MQCVLDNIAAGAVVNGRIPVFEQITSGQNVDQHHVGVQLLNHSQGFSAVLCLAHHVYLSPVLQQGAQALADDSVVFGL